MTLLKHLWSQHRLALLAFVAALGAAGFFGIRTMSAMVYWMDPAHQEQPLASWMTPRYVAQSYGLPRTAIEELFMLERGVDPPRIRLGEIMENMDMTMDELQARVDAAKAAHDSADPAARRTQDTVDE